jgi:Tetratricopeptide repeat
MKRTLLFASWILSAALVAAPQKTPESMLGAALHQEEVEGDLKGAIASYEKVLAATGVSRKTAAEALLHIGQCYEKLGSTESRKAYERIVREYADQKDTVTTARARLGASAAAHRAGIMTRQVWTGPNVDYLGTVSPDGQSLSFTDWETGDLAIHDLASGTNRRLTNKGSWANSGEFAEESAIS